MRSRSSAGKPLQRRCLDIGRRPFDSELIREPRRAAHHVFAAGSGPMQQSSEASVFQMRSMAWSVR